MAAVQPGILTRNPWVPRRPISGREGTLTIAMLPDIAIPVSAILR